MAPQLVLPLNQEDAERLIGSYAVIRVPLFIAVEHGIGVKDPHTGTEVHQVRGYGVNDENIHSLGEADLRITYAGYFPEMAADTYLLYAGGETTVAQPIPTSEIPDPKIYHTAYVWVPPRTEIQKWANFIAVGDWDPENGAETFLLESLQRVRSMLAPRKALLVELTVGAMKDLLEGKGMENTGPNRATVISQVAISDDSLPKGYELEDLPGWAAEGT